MRKISQRIHGALCAALLIVAGSSASAQPSHLEPGSRLPELRFPNLDGGTSSFRDFDGERFILHVFASW